MHGSGVQPACSSRGARTPWAAPTPPLPADATRCHLYRMSTLLKCQFDQHFNFTKMSTLPKCQVCQDVNFTRPFCRGKYHRSRCHTGEEPLHPQPYTLNPTLLGRLKGKEIQCKTSGHEVECTNALLLLIKIILCSKLHCQEASN